MVEVWKEGDKSKEDFIALTNLHLEQLLDLLPGNFFIYDQQGRWVFSNKAQIEYTYPYSLLGEDIRFLAVKANPNHKEKALKYANEIQHNNVCVMQTKKTRAFVETMPVSGKNKYFISHKAPLYNKDGEVIGLFGYATDITEHKEALLREESANKRLKQIIESQMRFLANVSHDIKTPLSGVHGLLQLIMEKNKDSEINDHAGQALSSINQLFHYFGKIIEAERTLNHQEKKPKKPKPINLKALVQQCIELHTPLAKLKSIALNCEMEETFPSGILLAQESMWAVLTNLIANAIKFTQEGSVSVQIKQVQRYNRPYFSILIKDTGCGISRKALKHIFDPFYRIKTDCTNNNHGSGLGLSIVKKHIQKMRGQITVESTEGVGTTFFCHIPLTLTSEKAEDKPYQIGDTPPPLPKQTSAKPAHSTRKDSNQSADSLTVVLVEDDPIITMASEHLIQKCIPGVNLLTFDCAQKTLDHFENDTHLADLFIFDVGLPDIPGNKLATMLQAYPQIKRSTPMVALTGHGVAVTKDAFDAVYNKPITTESFIQMLENHLPHAKYKKMNIT